MSKNTKFEKHTWAEIDLDALKQNYALIQKHMGDVPVCAVVKADAYGHGDLAVARTLAKQGAAWFAVSCLQEAIHLRKGGILQPILILGYTDPNWADKLIKFRITQAVMSLDYAKALNAAARNAHGNVRCHLKVDTGMGRIGFDVLADMDRAVDQMHECFSLKNLKINGMFQHFAVADSDKPENIVYTQKQCERFLTALQKLEDRGHDIKTAHCCNSAAQMQHAEWGLNLVRAGIILYGCNPSHETPVEGITPLMTLKTVVTHVKTLQPGESVSYGRLFTAEKPTVVATLAAGYADGYPRLLSGKGVVSLHGKAAPVVGRVCMDQILVDVTDIPDVAMGDEVTLFGNDGIADSVDDVADKSGTISYEVLCDINRRVPRVYKEGGQIVSVLQYLRD